MKKQLATVMVRDDTVVVLRYTGSGTGACIQTHREEYKLSSMTSGVRAMFDAVLAKLEPYPVKGSNTVFYQRRYSHGTNEAVAS